jgi:hypothetical protein
MDLWFWCFRSVTVPWFSAREYQRPRRTGRGFKPKFHQNQPKNCKLLNYTRITVSFFLIISKTIRLFCTTFVARPVVWLCGNSLHINQEFGKIRHKPSRQQSLTLTGRECWTKNVFHFTPQIPSKTFSAPTNIQRVTFELCVETRVVLRVKCWVSGFNQKFIQKSNYN